MVSLFDRRLLVVVDGQAVVDYAYDDDRAVRPDSRPLALGRDGLGLIVDSVRIYRDIYYTPPHGGKNVRSVRLSDYEYYVLGDNSEISSDSRNWPGGAAISAKLLVGKPLSVHLPSRAVVVGGCEFQVPDIGRIRYIR